MGWSGGVMSSEVSAPCEAASQDDQGLVRSVTSSSRETETSEERSGSRILAGSEGTLSIEVTYPRIR